MSEDIEDEDEDFESDTEYVTPGCCEMVKEYCTVFLGLPEGFYEGNPDKLPKWKVRAWNKKFESTTHVDAQFCPHCAKPVPEVVRVEPPKPVCKCSDGGYYCDTCHGRLNECRCLRPEKAWGPKND